MVQVRSTQSSFSGGIVSRELWSRTDFNKLSSCVAEDINFRLRPSGSASFRSGTRFICEAASQNTERLQKFVYTREDYGVLEFFVDANNRLSMRFIKNKRLVTTSGSTTPYVLRIKTRWDSGTTDAAYFYNADDLEKLSIVQNKNNVYIAGPNMVPTYLTRVADNNWTQSKITLGYTNRVPKVTSVTVVPGTAPSPTVQFDKYYWGATVYLDDGTETELTRSAAVSADVQISEQPCDVTIKADLSSLSADDKAKAQIFVYRVSGGQMYFIYALRYSEGTGTDAERTFTLKDPGLAYDKSHSEPLIFKTFAGTDINNVFTENTPTVVAIHKQRLILAASQKDPNKFWCSRVGLYDDFTYNLATMEDMAYDRELSVGDEDKIVAFVPMDDLLVGTESKIWRITGSTPTTASAFIETHDGIKGRPVATKKSVLYLNSVSNSLNNFLYSDEQGGYVGEELDLLSKELFDGYTIKDFDIQNYPVQTIHVVRSDNKMFCITYVKEQNIYGWYRIGIDGTVHNVCSVTGATEDEVYIMINRADVRGNHYYIECFDKEFNYSDTQATARFLDSFEEIVKTPEMTRIGPITRFATLTMKMYFNGDVVDNIVFDANGYADIPRTLTIPDGETMVIGYPYSGVLKTLPKEIALQGNDTVGIRRRLAGSAFVRVYNTRGLKLGSSEDSLEEVKPYRNEDCTTDNPMPLFSGLVETTVRDNSEVETSFIIRQDNPLPAFIQSITTEVDYEYHSSR